MKFAIKDFCGKCDQVLSGKLHFLCSDCQVLLVMIFEQFIPNNTCIDREKAAVFITHCMRWTHLPIKNRFFSQKADTEKSKLV